MKHKTHKNALAMMSKPTPKPNMKPDMTANPAKKATGHPHKNLGHYLHPKKKKG